MWTLSKGKGKQVSALVPGTRFVPSVNGHGWTFDHNGFTYQMVHLNGSDRVTLSCRVSTGGEWTFGHARELNGRLPHMVAREILRDITAPTGVVEGRRWLVESAGFTRDDVNAMSNDVVRGQVNVNHVDGWTGFLRAIGAE